MPDEISPEPVFLQFQVPQRTLDSWPQELRASLLQLADTLRQVELPEGHRLEAAPFPVPPPAPFPEPFPGPIVCGVQERLYGPVNRGRRQAAEGEAADEAGS